MATKRSLGLDSLRGLAVGLVILRHAWPHRFGGAGIVGVTIFFTLSGYLITGILARELERSGRVDLRRFYVRRLRRLAPALLTVVGIFALIETSLHPVNERLGPAVLVGVLYLQDIPPYITYPGINHLWTLAVEEQFYLLWPLVLALSFRSIGLVRGVRRLLGLSLVLPVILGLAAGAAGYVTALYPLPTTWAVCLVAGGWYRLEGERRMELWPAWGASWPLALVGLLTISVAPDLKNSLLTYLVGGALVALLTLPLIGVAQGWKGPIARMLAGLGLISYSAYLCNGPVAHWVIDRAHQNPAWTLPATVAAAWISWRLVERRFMK